MRFACALLLAVLGALLWPASPASAAEVVQPTLVQTIQTSAYSPPSPDPSGIVYMPAQDRLLIADSEVNEAGLYRGSNLFTATRTGSGFGSGTLLARGNLAETSAEPAGIGFNPSDRTLYVSDDDRDRVSVVRPGPDGVHGTADDTVTRFSTSSFGSGDPEDVEYDPASGHLFICDGAGIEIYDVNPVNGVFGDGNDVVTHFDLARYGARECEGLGLDASRNALLAVDWRTDAIYELSTGGAHLRTLRLTAIPTSNSVVADVTMAPSSNPNDSPSAFSYWVVDRHVDNQAQSPPPIDGLLYEMSLGASPAQRTLTVQTQGAGAGTVTGPGISCPGDCTETYPDGQPVILTATPGHRHRHCHGPGDQLPRRLHRDLRQRPAGHPDRHAGRRLELRRLERRLLRKRSLPADHGRRQAGHRHVQSQSRVPAHAYRPDPGRRRRHGHGPGDQLPRRLHRDLRQRSAGHPDRHAGRAARASAAGAAPAPEAVPAS